MKTLGILLVPILLLVASSSYGARVYKWSDSDGVHYSDRRPSQNAKNSRTMRVKSNDRRHRVDRRNRIVQSNAATGRSPRNERGSDIALNQDLLAPVQPPNSTSSTGSSGGSGGGSGAGSTAGSTSSNTGSDESTTPAGATPPRSEDVVAGLDTGSGGTETIPSTGVDSGNQPGADTPTDDSTSSPADDGIISGGSETPTASENQTAAADETAITSETAEETTNQEAPATSTPTSSEPDPEQVAQTVEVVDIPGDTPTQSEPESSASGTSSSGHTLNCANHKDALLCYKFSTQTNVRNVWTNSDSSCVPTPSYDAIEKAGRLGVKMSCGPNTSGTFRFNWSTKNDIWIQFRYKPSSAFLSARPPKGAKVMVTWAGTSSCSSNEFTEENTANRGYPQWYEACGAGKIRTSIGSDFNLQPGGDTVCHYQSPTERSGELCLEYEPLWATRTFHLNMAENRVDGWVQYDGQSRVHVLSHSLSSNGINQAYFGPYMTDNSGGSSSVLDVWYQDFLVTTKPLF